MAHLNNDIPTYQRQAGYTATINPQVPQGSPSAFGTTVAKEQAGFGENLSKLGNMLAEHAIKMQQQADDNAVVRQENELRAYMNDVINNPDSGLAVQKGHNAKGATLAYDEIADKQLREAINNMPSENMKTKLYERAAGWISQYRNTVARNEGQEVNAAYIQDIKTSYSNAEEVAISTPGANSFNTLAIQAQTTKGDLMHFSGLSSETADQTIQIMLSDSYVKMADILNSNGDTQGLLDLAAAGHGKVTADAEVKVARMSGELKTQMAGESIARSYFNNPAYKKADGTFDYAKALEDLTNTRGPGATKKVRKYVGGGGYSGDSATDTMLNNAAATYSVDPLLVAAIASTESGYDQSQVSKAGAIGVMQLMPDTAKELGVDPNNKESNINGGTKYIKQLLDTFGGDVNKAIAAYNAGPQAVKDYNGIPPYKETQDYVNKVLNAYEQLKTSNKTIEPRDMATQGSNIDAQVQSLKPGWQSAIPSIGGILHSKFGVDGVISSGARSAEHNAEVNGSPTSYHIDNGSGGDALDIVLPDGTSAAKANEIKNYFEQTGAFSEVLFHDSGSGYHLHLGGLKGNLDTGGGQGHWEEVEVSAYNEKEFKAAYQAIERQGHISKSNHDNEIQNAVNALLPLAKDMKYISEVEDLVKSKYPNMAPTDVSAVVKAVASDTVSNNRSDEGYKYQQERRNYEQNSRDFYTWRLSNPNASPADIIKAAETYNLESHEQFAIQKSLGLGGGLKDLYVWGKDPDNEKTFNGVCGDFKLTGIEKSNVREKLNAESERRQAAGEPPLTMADIRSFVQGEASLVTINKNALPFSGQQIKTADIPIGWTKTEYGVLDPNGNTMVYDEETQSWEVMNS